MGRECLHFALRRAARAITRRYDDALAEVGVSANQLTVLAILQAMGTLTVGELAEQAGVDVTTMTRTLQPLRRERLVSARPGKDRRTRRISLTAEGRSRLNRAHEVWQGLQVEVSAAMPPTLVRSLRRLEKALGGRRDQPSEGKSATLSAARTIS